MMKKRNCWSGIEAYWLHQLCSSCSAALTSRTRFSSLEHARKSCPFYQSMKSQRKMHLNGSHQQEILQVLARCDQVNCEEEYNYYRLSPTLATPTGMFYFLQGQQMLLKLPAAHNLLHNLLHSLLHSFLHSLLHNLQMRKSPLKQNLKCSR